MDSVLIEQVVNREVDRAMMQDMVWGVDDCSLWVCNITRDVTGVDLAEPLRGYRCSFGAARALRRFAGGGLIEAAIKIAANNGLAQAGRPFRGNLIGVVMSPHRPSLALFWRGGWLARAQSGVTYLPKAAGIIAWRWA